MERLKFVLRNMGFYLFLCAILGYGLPCAVFLNGTRKYTDYQTLFPTPDNILWWFGIWLKYLFPKNWSLFTSMSEANKNYLLVIVVLGVIVPVISISILTHIFRRIIHKHSTGPKVETIRGMDAELNQAQFIKLANRAVPKNDQGIYIHREFRMKRSAENEGFLVLGGTGCGKTKSIVNRIVTQAVHRKEKVIILDSKGDFTAVYGERHGAYLLAPWDKRSARWDLSADISRPLDTELIANSIIPPIPNDHQPIFRDTAFNMLNAVLKSLWQNKNLSWDRLYKTINDKRLLNQCLSRYPSGAACLQILNGNEQQAEVFLSSLRTFTAFIGTLAQAWPNPIDSFSIRDWLSKEEGGILILRYASDFVDISRKVSSLACSIAISELLSWPVTEQRPVWFILDEIANLNAKISNLAEGITAGRERGAKFLLATQDVTRLDNVYGINESRSMLNSLNTFIAFAISDKLNAEYAAGCLGGEREEKILTTSRGASNRYGKSSGDGTSINFQENFRTSKVVYSSELKQLKKGQGFIRLSGLPLGRVQFNPITFETKFKHEVFADWVNAIEEVRSFKTKQGDGEASKPNQNSEVEHKTFTQI